MGQCVCMSQYQSIQESHRCHTEPQTHVHTNQLEHILRGVSYTPVPLAHIIKKRDQIILILKNNKILTSSFK